jgi:hypothetical protein
MERSSNGLIWGTIMEFTCKNWRKPCQYLNHGSQCLDQGSESASLSTSRKHYPWQTCSDILALHSRFVLLSNHSASFYHCHYNYFYLHHIIIIIIIPSIKFSFFLWSFPCESEVASIQHIWLIKAWSFHF